MEEGRGVSPEGRDGTRVEAGAGPQVEEKEDCPGTPRAPVMGPGWKREQDLRWRRRRTVLEPPVLLYPPLWVGIGPGRKQEQRLSARHEWAACGHLLPAVTLNSDKVKINIT